MNQIIEDLFEKADNLRNENKVFEAVEEYKKIAEQSAAEDDSLHEARAYHMAGVALGQSVTGDASGFRDAISYFKKAESLFLDKGSAIDLGNLYRDCGIVLYRAGKKEQSLDWIEKSIKVLGQAADRKNLAISYGKRGYIIGMEGDIDAGIADISSGIEILRPISDAGFFYATMLLDLASLMAVRGEYDKAIDLAIESLSWFRADHGKRQYSRRESEATGLLSLLYYKKNLTDDAKKMAEQYQALLKTFNPMAASSVEARLETIAQKIR